MHGSASSEALETPNQQPPYLQAGLAPSPGLGPGSCDISA